MYSTQQNLFLQYWKRCKVTIKAVYLIAQWWYCCRQSKPNRSFRNKLAAGLCKARTSKFISLYRNPHSCTDLTQKYILAVCHYHLSYSAVQHGPFCGTATKLNIPVSEHFGKLQTPIGISSVRIRWNIPRLVVLLQSTLIKHKTAANIGFPNNPLQAGKILRTQITEINTDWACHIINI